MFTLLNLNLFTLDIYHLVSLLYKEVMEESNNFCFNDGDKEFISITSYGAILTNNQQKCRLVFSKTSLKLANDQLLDYCYFFLL